jgi:hypothetical protein
MRNEQLVVNALRRSGKSLRQLFTKALEEDYTQHEIQTFIIQYLNNREGLPGEVIDECAMILACGPSNDNPHPELSA